MSLMIPVKVFKFFRKNSSVVCMQFFKSEKCHQNKILFQSLKSPLEFNQL
jgi:hypothetical protein